MTSVRIVELHTSEGTLSVELYDRVAPHLCTSFAQLAESGQLNGPLFRQMVPGFAVVGNAYQCRDNDTVYGLLANSHDAPTSSSSALHHVGAGLFTCVVEEGTVATARFLVTLAPQPLLDKTYTVFGRLYSGLSVLMKLAKMQTDSHGNLFSPIVVHRCNLLTVPAVAPPRTTAERHAASAPQLVRKGRLVSSLDE